MKFDDIKNNRDVRINFSKRYPNLATVKYQNRVFWENRWDDTLIECRGHVYDIVTGDRVVNGPTKVFNLSELGLNKKPTIIHRDEEVLAVRKINGFLGCATYVPSVDKVVVSTTGSLDSDFVGYAESKLGQRVFDYIKMMYLENNANFTWFFEICHEDDPHIIPEKIGAYLLGARVVCDSNSYRSDSEWETELDFYAKRMGVMRPKWKTGLFGDIVKETNECNHEGHMIYGKDTVLKLKSPYYKILKLLARKKDILSLDIKKCDEEFHTMINLCLKTEGFNTMEEQDRLNFMRKYLENQ